MNAQNKVFNRAITEASSQRVLVFVFFTNIFSLFIIALRLQNALITLSVLYLARTYNMRERIYEGKRVYAVCLFFLVDLGG